MALTTVNSGGIKDDSIVNADIKSDAAIALSKLASTPAVLTGSTNNTITTVTAANTIQGEANLTFDGSNLNIVDGGAIIGGGSDNDVLVRLDHEDNTGKAEIQLNAWGSSSISLISNFSGSTYQGVENGSFGLSSAHARDINFVTAGSERFRIRSGGDVQVMTNLGIGITPSKKLHVQGLDVALRLESTAATGRIGMEFYDTSAQKGFFGYPSSGNDNLAIQQNEAADLYFYVNGADRLHIASDGNVGINQSSPGDLLEIHPASNNDGITIKDTGEVYPALTFDVNRTGADQFLGNIRGAWNGTTVANIILETGDDTTNKDDGVITFRTASAGSPAERLRIESGGNIKINDGDLVIGGTGHGIDFSNSQTPAGGMTSELLDHYEEGTFTATPADAASGGNASSTTFTGYYIRIGKQVTIFVRMLNVDSTGLTGANDLYIQGVPFTSGNLTNMEFVGAASVHADTTSDSTAFVSNILNNDNFARFYEQRENTSRDYLRCQEINDATTDIIFALTYIAAS